MGHLAAVDCVVSIEIKLPIERYERGGLVESLGVLRLGASRSAQDDGKDGRGRLDSL
jgi:hypothetical protein